MIIGRIRRFFGARKELRHTRYELEQLQAKVDKMDEIVSEIIEWGQHNQKVAEHYKEMSLRLKKELNGSDT